MNGKPDEYPVIIYLMGKEGKDLLAMNGLMAPNTESLQLTQAWSN